MKNKARPSRAWEKFDQKNNHEKNREVKGKD